MTTTGFAHHRLDAFHAAEQLTLGAMLTGPPKRHQRADAAD